MRDSIDKTLPLNNVANGSEDDEETQDELAVVAGMILQSPRNFAMRASSATGHSAKSVFAKSSCAFAPRPSGVSLQTPQWHSFHSANLRHFAFNVIVAPSAHI